MDHTVDEYFAEYRVLSAALYRYSPSSQGLSEPERVFSDLFYYWSAVIVNNGDVFGYVPFIIEHKADFMTIGAEKTLKALDGLMPFYRQQEQLKGDIEKGEYWWSTKDERTSAEGLADDMNEFARLLLAYAQTHLPPLD